MYTLRLSQVLFSCLWTKAGGKSDLIDQPLIKKIINEGVTVCHYHPEADYFLITGHPQSVYAIILFNIIVIFNVVKHPQDKVLLVITYGM